MPELPILNVPSSPRTDASSVDPSSPPPAALREYVARAVRRYLTDLDDCPADDLYGIVLREVEAPLFREVMRHCDGNQTRAAAALGLNRATLRKKLREHGLA